MEIMARVTVEDCVEKVPNRFKLVLLAGQRAKDISSGSPITVDRDNDKNSVIALREIADETIDVNMLEDRLISSMQHVAKTKESTTEEELKIDPELAALDEEFKQDATEQVFADTEAFQITEEA